MKLAIHVTRGSRRSKHVAKALAAGARRLGWRAETLCGQATAVRGDLAAGYGWLLHPVFAAYRAAGGHFLYVDLGYWSRKPGGDLLNGYHKLVLDGRHPHIDLDRDWPAGRLRRQRVVVQPPRRGGTALVVAGMSAKNARVLGLQPEQWERAAVATLRDAGWAGRIVYRPKPSWDGARRLPGAAFSPGCEPLDRLFAGARAVATHSSNAAVDALAAGLPAYCEDGAALPLSCGRLAALPWAGCPDRRETLLTGLAWHQWTPAEIATGEALAFYRESL